MNKNSTTNIVDERRGGDGAEKTNKSTMEMKKKWKLKMKMLNCLRGALTASQSATQPTNQLAIQLDSFGV